MTEEGALGLLRQRRRTGSAASWACSSFKCQTDRSDPIASTYDDENQLATVASTSEWKIEFSYDGRGRMRVRKDYTWSAGSWALSKERRYLYDGMLIVQERSSGNNPEVTYTRGTDLSGSFEGAGGIGGLLSRGVHSGASPYGLSSAAHYHMDGNGNVTMMVGTGTPSIKAYYRYDVFGRTLESGGVLAADNAMRFSSKPVMGQSEIYYFGYRHFDPNSARWLNRDPINEAGGVNLYGYVYNSPVNFIDPFGLCKVEGRYEKIGSILGLSWHHAYVVVTEPDGSQTYYRGGPSTGGPSGGSSGAIGSGSGGSSSQKCCGSSQSNSSNSSNSSSPGSSPGGGNTGPWGKISTQSGPYVPGTIDWDPNPSPSVVVQNDNQPCGCKGKLQSALDRINNANIPYNPFGDNSNATAHQIIEDAGFPRPNPPVWAPGSGDKLP